MRKGMYAARDITAGSIVSADDIRVVRPETPVGPDSYFDQGQLHRAASVQRTTRLTSEAKKPAAPESELSQDFKLGRSAALRMKLNAP